MFVNNIKIKIKMELMYIMKYQLINKIKMKIEKELKKLENKKIKKDTRSIVKYRLVSESEEVVPEYPRVLLVELNSPVMKNLERQLFRFRLYNLILIML